MISSAGIVLLETPKFKGLCDSDVAFCAADPCLRCRRSVSGGSWMRYALAISLRSAQAV